MVFRVKDYSGVNVILSEVTWFKKLQDPIFGHPEVKPFLLNIKSTIKNPEIVYQSTRDKSSKLLYTEITKGTFSSYFLVVVVKYVKERKKTVGHVSTVMINRGVPKKSKIIWEREVST